MARPLWMGHLPVVWRVLTKMSPGLNVGAREIEEIIREEIINRDILGSEKIKLT